MKVEQKSVRKFEPIIITLETEEEAHILWHSLNRSEADCTVDIFDMWKKFNGIYQHSALKDC